MARSAPKIRKALPGDAVAIKTLINSFAARGWMLPRSLSDIYEGIRDFWVLEDRGKVAGCVSLHICWENMAEVRSLAVGESHQKKGWGDALVKTCFREAKRMGIKRIFTLTYIPAFFARRGFREIPKEELPHKIWQDCLNCPHFPGCKEVAMLKTLGE